MMSLFHKGLDHEIKDDEIKDDEIKDDEIKDDEIKDDEIKDDEIKDDEIKDDEIKDDGIKDDGIKDDEIKDDEIKDDEIKDDEIKDDQIKDDEIKDDEIKDDELKDKFKSYKKTDYHCGDCDIYFLSEINLNNHFKTLKHEVKLERIKILETSKNSDNIICYIPLRKRRKRKNMIIDYTIVDKDIYPLIMNYPIYKNSEGYANITVNNKITSLHRYIYYDLRNKEPIPETVVDHMDRKKLNNTLCNLQEVINGNNCRNRTKKAGCTSDYYGVCKNGKKWQCSLRYNNITHTFLYDDELHAAYHHDLLVKEFNLQNHNPLNNVECPLDFIIKIKNVNLIKKDGLPKNIYTSDSKYRCRFKGEFSNKSKSGFKTVEEAVLYRDNVLELIKKEEINKLNRPYDKPIQRNSMGIAMMDILNYKNEIVEKTLLDDDIYCYLMKRQHTLSLSKGGYANIQINGKKQHLHRWLMDYSGEHYIDHIDNISLNNQKSNLRISSSLQNSQNRKASKNVSSIYIGVSLRKERKRWQSQIQGEYLGDFETEEEAVIIRNKRAEELNEQGATYRIEIYSLSTEQIKKFENNQKQIKTLEVNNKLFIEYQETPEDILYKEYIMNITKVTILYKEVMRKKLNVKNGGPIKVSDIKLNNLDKYKKIMIDTLYPSC